MKLEIKKFLKGALCISENEEGWVECSRFMPNQRNAYREDWRFYMCALGDAGICLSLSTDARKISFECRIASGYGTGGVPDKGKYEEEDWQVNQEVLYGNSFDVEVNGNQVLSIPWKQGNISFEIENPDEKVQEVNAFFPFMIGSAVRNLCVEGTIANTIKTYKKMLFLGDSITQGANCMHSGGIWPVLGAKGKRMELINQGVCGYVFRAESIATLEDAGFVPEEIVVAYGTNDWADIRDEERLTGNMRDFFTQLERVYGKVKKYVVTPLPRMDESTVEACMPLQLWREYIAKEAGKYPSISVLSGMELMGAEKDLFADGVLHPNDKGAKEIAAHLLKVIQ